MMKPLKISLYWLSMMCIFVDSSWAEGYWLAHLKEIRESAPESAQKREVLDYAINTLAKIPDNASEEDRLALQKQVFDRLVYEAEDQGNSWALFLLGYFYECGIYVSKNLGQAYEKMKQAAQLNNPEAQFRLGSYLADDNSGAPYVNMAEAAYYMREASMQGVEAATHMLKLWFIKEMVPSSYLKETKEMTQKQVQKQLQLAQMYYNGYVKNDGEKVEPDLMQAYIALNDVIPGAVYIPKAELKATDVHEGKKIRLPFFRIF